MSLKNGGGNHRDNRRKISEVQNYRIYNMKS